MECAAAGARCGVAALRASGADKYTISRICLTRAQNLAMDVQVGNLSQLSWIWLFGFCLATSLFAAVARRRARTRFATANLLRSVLPPRGSLGRILGTPLATAALALMVIAL